MNKPITVAKQEFTESIVNLANESGLPAFIMRGVLKELDNALAQLEQEQLKADKAKWENEQEKEVDNAGR